MPRSISRNSFLDQDFYAKRQQKVSKLLGESTAQYLRAHFERVGEMQGAHGLFKRIASAPDEDQLDDYLAEIRYALVFAGLGFQVEVEPAGKKGPDLGISRDGHCAVVEVKRIRKAYPGLPTLDFTHEPDALPDYGCPPRDIRKAYTKVHGKFPQVQDGESIIAIWNDEEVLEQEEVQAATVRLLNEAAQGLLNLPSDLLFILYGSTWVGPGPDRKQLYCFPVRYPVQEHQRIWQTELDSSNVKDLRQRALTQFRIPG